MVEAHPSAASGIPLECPVCHTTLLPGAIACMECGFLLQPEAAPQQEGPPNLCTNPACGVVNSPKDRVCQRCGSPLPTAPGTILHGRYRIERQLAVGGFGAVYLATDTKEGNRPVAVKDMICADSQEFSIRLNFFQREAEILRSLAQIPIVPRVYDFIQQGQTAHLVMEFIRGQDLLKIMENQGDKPFPIERVIEWGKSICDVLIHMHGMSPPLVHRDLKPDNIMLLDGSEEIRLIDFGTARDMGRTPRTRLAAKTRVYTEGYAPPEQILGRPEPRSDLFALAGTLYHLSTGKAPEGFYTSRDLESQLAALTSLSLSPSQVPPSVSPPDAGGRPRGGDVKEEAKPASYRWFFELLKINLAEDPNDRYFSARELKNDLARRQVSEKAVCPKCHTTNRVREPYCCKCGEPLTDLTPPCNHCGKENRMGSRCCIYCGNRLGK
jgi:serine/threonine protein kinase